jgi:hypothetical protein
MKFIEKDRKSRTHQIQHNFTQQHILQCSQGTLITLRRQILKRLEKVGVRSCVILVFGVENAGLEIESGLKGGGAVDRVGSGSGGC